MHNEMKYMCLSFLVTLSLSAAVFQAVAHDLQVMFHVAVRVKTIGNLLQMTHFNRHTHCLRKTLTINLNLKHARVSEYAAYFSFKKCVGALLCKMISVHSLTLKFKFLTFS